MAYPNYENFKQDIDDMIAMMSRLNSFAVLKDDEIKSDRVTEEELNKPMDKNIEKLV